MNKTIFEIMNNNIDVKNFVYKSYIIDIDFIKKHTVKDIKEFLKEGDGYSKSSYYIIDKINNMKYSEAKKLINGVYYTCEDIEDVLGEVIGLYDTENTDMIGIME